MGKIRAFKARKEKEPLQVGTKFGRLTVTAESLPTSSERQYRYYECTCDCGKIIFPRKDTLINGDSTSCGCFAAEKAGERAKTHGLSKHPLYSVWEGMNKRCYNEKRKDFKHYGGRGIKVSDAWKEHEGLNQFIEDMYPTYEIGLELDRIDVNGDYCKDNCRWATRRQQVINRRELGSSFDTHYLEYKGEKLCMSEWADKIGIPATMISDRITTLGWSVEKTLTTPPKIRTSRVVFGEHSYEPKDMFRHYPNVYAVARKLGITGHDYLHLLFSKFGKLEVYLCKQWVPYQIAENLKSFDIYTRKVPDFSDYFMSKGIIINE